VVAVVQAVVDVEVAGAVDVAAGARYLCRRYLCYIVKVWRFAIDFLCTLRVSQCCC
jgi:hypothetical protein